MPSGSGRRLLAGVAVLVVVSGGCRRERSAVRGQTDPGRRADDGPVVGGPCTYAPVAFAGIVDSALGNRDVILHPVDSVPSAAGFCHLLRDEGKGRWRVVGSLSTDVKRGDTVMVEASVIQTGTCTPCSIGTRPARER